MSADAIAARYANVLFELLKERGDLDDALRHFETLAQTMRREPDLGRFLLNPDVEVDEKLGVLTRVLGRDWPEDLTVFVRVVLSMGRAPHLVDIADAFRTLVDAHRHRVRVTVRPTLTPSAPDAGTTLYPKRGSTRFKAAINVCSRFASDCRSLTRDWKDVIKIGIAAPDSEILAARDEYTAVSIPGRSCHRAEGG